MIKTCEICGKTGQMRANQKYCGSQDLKDSCSYKATRKIKPPVKCVDCGREMKRHNQATPRCGNSSDFDSCAGKYALSLCKRPARNCAWCSEPLNTDDVKRRYHGTQWEKGSCAYQVQISNMGKHNKIRAERIKIPKDKVYITDYAAIDSGYF